METVLGGATDDETEQLAVIALVIDDVGGDLDGEGSYVGVELEGDGAPYVLVEVAALFGILPLHDGLAFE
ncbi:MAG: hypothetical protein KDB16_16715, partial [Acidimicrobiales bacterium]|nr:hypothetical protein [Acidimicrobiales bacterium]